MKEIEDQCGGWIETEEENTTQKSSEMGTASGKGPSVKIPAYVTVSGDEYTSLPVWCEAPSRFKLQEEERENREASTRKKQMLLQEKTQLIETNHNSIRKGPEIYPLDKDPSVGVASIRKDNHVTLTEGHVRSLIEEMGPDLILRNLGLLACHKCSGLM